MRETVFIGAGRADTMVPAAQTERLVKLLRDAGAEVAVHWEPGVKPVSLDRPLRSLAAFIGAGTIEREP